ncbi:hypothetical protein CsSME_00020032 [Camellia sinensis var. sinensis]
MKMLWRKGGGDLGRSCFRGSRKKLHFFQTKKRMK